jgi:hypothetical protein
MKRLTVGQMIRHLDHEGLGTFLIQLDLNFHGVS